MDFMDETSRLLEVLRPYTSPQFRERVAPILLLFCADLKSLPNVLSIDKKRKELQKIFQDVENEMILNARDPVPLEAISKLSLLHRVKCRETLLQMAKILTEKSDCDFDRLIYGNATTPDDADDIRKDFKRIFHPDLPWILRIEDPQQRVKNVELLTKLSYRFDLCLDRNFNPLIAVRDNKMFITKGDNHRKLSTAYDKRRKGDTSIVEDHEFYLTIDSLSSEKILEMKYHHAKLAVSFYRSALRMIDKEVDSERLVSDKIAVRNSISMALLLADHNFEAQIYLVGAISIASRWCNDFENLKKMLSALERNLSKIRERCLQPTIQGAQHEQPPPTSAGAQNNQLSLVLSNTTQLANKPSTVKVNAIRNSVNNHRKQWIISNYVLSSKPIDPSHDVGRSAATTYHMAASVTSGLGVTSVVGATVAEVSGIGHTVLALSAAGGPVGSIIATVGLVAMAGVSLYCYATASKNLTESTTRKKLNVILEESHQFFQNREITKFFTRLADVYDSNGNKLLDFVDGRKLHINSINDKDRPEWASSIINRLLSHGFHSDFVAYLLNCIAEGLLHESLVFNAETYITPDSRIQNALNIYADILEKNSPMDANVRELDQKISDLKKHAVLHRTSAWTAWVNKIRALHIDGIPQSYIDEAAVQPYHARFQEIQNISRLNSAILRITKYHDEDSRKLAEKHLKDAQESIQSNYQYFTVSIERLNALNDLFVAFEINVDEKSEESSSPVKEEDFALENPTPGPNLDNPSDFRYVQKVKWGDRVATCYGYEILSDDLDINSILKQLSINATTCTGHDLMRKLEKYIASRQSERFTVSPKGERIENPAVTSALLNAQHLQNLFVQQSHRLLVQNLVSSNVKLINQLFNANFVRCAFHPSQQCYGPSNERQLNGEEVVDEETIFIFCDKDRACDGDFPPTLAFCGSEFISDPSESTNIRDAKVLNQLGNLNTDYISSKCIAETRSRWAAAEAQFRRSLDLQDRSFWRVALNGLVPTVQLQSSWFQSVFEGSPLLQGKKISELEMETYFRYIECIIGSARITSAMNSLGVLSALPQLQETAKFWYLVALANRKLHLYEHALFAIHQSCKKAVEKKPLPTRSLEIAVNKEKGLLERLHSQRVTKPVLEYFKKKRVNIVYDSEGDKTPSSWYDIISIDGGGSLGIIPAMFIAEIEKRSHRPIAKAAKLIAGTSTGAIIAGAVGCRSHADFSRPVLSGQDLLELYSDPTRLNRIFAPSSHVLNLSGPKYIESGRASVIKEYVRESKMKDTLTDLVITAVKKGQQHTKLFNPREDSDALVYDAIMASSAAPTYFPGHMIGSDLYFDGGLHANSPSQLALAYAQRTGISPQKIRIWSLGTGNYGGDNNSVSKNGGLFEWATSAFQFALNGQAANVDHDLHTLLGNERYSRWQVWFDEPVAIDAIDEDSVLNFTEYAREFIEENDDLVNRCAKCLGGH